MEIFVSVLRDDKVHPFLSGNKWRKLKYNLEDFYNSGKKTVLTFGGAFSNHLVAVAEASKEFNFRAIAVVRGEEIQNPYLDFIRSKGVNILFVSRTDYRRKNNDEFVAQILDMLVENKVVESGEEVFIVPEGGSNTAAVRGTAEIVGDIRENFDWVACACGTGGTIAGISTRLSGKQKALGIPVLKAGGYMMERIKQLGGNPDKVFLNENYHFGGYGRSNKELRDFCHDFTNVSGIPVEPVYTGKLFFAIDDLIKNGYFKKGEKVTVVHTGGIFYFSNPIGEFTGKSI
jgi:1-aminocyclopropane-1-carboxylate deaminase